MGAGVRPATECPAARATVRRISRCTGRRVDQGEAELGRRDQPRHLERRLDENGAGGDEEAGVEVGQAAVAAARLVEVAARARLGHRGHLLAHQVRGDRDDAGAAQLHHREQHVVVARVDRQARTPPTRRHSPRSGFACFTRHDVRDLGELGDEVGLQVDAAAAGDVVEDHRQADLGDGGDVAHDPGPRGAVVVGRDDQARVGAGLGREVREVHRVGRVVAAGAGHDAGAAAHLAHRQAVRGRPSRRRSAWTPRPWCRPSPGRRSRAPPGGGPGRWRRPRQRADPHRRA